MSGFEKNITPEYLRQAAKQAEGLKNLTYSIMGLENSQKILDLGCGPGVDLIPIAKQIHENALVYGIDISQSMLDEAMAFASGEGVENKIEVICSSVNSLPFNPNFFDAIRAERLFQVLDPKDYNADTIFGDLKNILKPEGRLVVADTDWASASVDFSDNELERKFIDFFCGKCRPNGFSGRQFYKLFSKHRFKNIQVHVIPHIMYDINESPLGNWLVDEIISQDAATIDETEKWMSELQERSGKDEMFATVNMIVVSGHK